MNFVGCSSSSQCVLNNSDVSSSDDEADSACTLRTRRSLPHGAFAHALKSSRLQSNPVNSSNHWIGENPKYGNTMMLYSKTGFHLKVTPDGKVCGTREEIDPFAIMEIGSAGTVGHITIQGKESKLFIAMDRKGRLYGEANKNRPQTIWLEELIGSYTTYMSRNYAHLGWFMGIKKSGKPKKGVKTGWGQRATQFLPRRLT